jgi:DNA primase
VWIDQILARAAEAQTTKLPEPSFRRVSCVQGETLSARIKAAISVEEFVGQYVELDSQLRSHCPFHDDQHKSFSVNTKGGYWHCFLGCGGGSIIDFYRHLREKNGQDGSFVVTITELAQMLL